MALKSSCKGLASEITLPPEIEEKKNPAYHTLGPGLEFFNNFVY
jgi:hypothetical protein